MRLLPEKSLPAFLGRSPPFRNLSPYTCISMLLFPGPSGAFPLPALNRHCLIFPMNRAGTPPAIAFPGDDGHDGILPHGHAGQNGSPAPYPSLPPHHDGTPRNMTAQFRFLRMVLRNRLHSRTDQHAVTNSDSATVHERAAAIHENVPAEPCKTSEIGIKRRPRSKLIHQFRSIAAVLKRPVEKHPGYMMLLRVHLFRLNSHTSATETAEARQASKGIFTAEGRPPSPMKFTKS